MRTLLELGALALGGWWAWRNLRPRYDFRGKNVLVTGGSRGLGLVLSRALAKRGASVAICARDEEELAAARRDLGGNAVALRADVTDQAQVRRFVAEARAALGEVDVLVNNAGIIGVGPLETQTLDDFDRCLKTHFWASLYTILEVLPAMKARKAGRIVNISSFGGKVGVPHLAPYAASKFALVGLSQSLRAELAEDGITVTTVCPGLMRTGSHLNAEFKGQHDREYAWFAAGNALTGFSISAESAAESILDACARGDAEAVLSLPAQLAVAMQALMPNLVAELSALADQWMMPGPGGIGTRSVKGADSRGVLPAWVTANTDADAERNNELVAAGK
ncbi:MAG: SDR family oxidoreductase [Gemmataceae bacterium]|nr:SDR family oxidoreductase [Gemmataceae bacterium]